MALFIMLGNTICIKPQWDKPQNKSLSHYIILVEKEQIDSLRNHGWLQTHSAVTSLHASPFHHQPQMRIQ